MSWSEILLIISIFYYNYSSQMSEEERAAIMRELKPVFDLYLTTENIVSIENVNMICNSIKFYNINVENLTNPNGFTLDELVDRLIISSTIKEREEQIYKSLLIFEEPNNKGYINIANIKRYLSLSNNDEKINAFFADFEEEEIDIDTLVTKLLKM